MLCSSLSVLTLLLAYVPLSLLLKMSVAYLQGAQMMLVDSVSALNQASLCIGDTLFCPWGTSMYYIQSGGGQIRFSLSIDRLFIGTMRTVADAGIRYSRSRRSVSGG